MDKRYGDVVPLSVPMQKLMHELMERINDNCMEDDECREWIRQEMDDGVN